MRTSIGRWDASARTWLCAAGYGLRSVVSVRGERSTIEEIQLSDLLSVVDETGRTVRPG
jgi:hypothetical protein